MPSRRTDSPTAILVAVEEELKPLLRRCSSLESESVLGARIYRGTMGGRTVCLSKSGVGRENAARAAAALIERASPSSLVIVGFAGSLAVTVLPGDLVIADAVHDVDQPALAPDACLAHVAVSVALPGVRACSGTVITGPGVQQSPSAKRALATDHRGAIALDMESSGAASVAQRCGVPWVVVRAITDGVGDSMPLPFDRFIGSDGEMQRARIVAAVLVRPWKIAGLVRLGARSGRAAGNLAAFIEAYVRALSVAPLN